METHNTTAGNANKYCLCKTLQKDQLIKELNTHFDYKKISEAQISLFSETAIFLSREELNEVNDCIEALESVIRSEAYQLKIMRDSHHLVTRGLKTNGVLMGYDFHLTTDGPKLIEINTNAGGVYLNLILAKAQIACCEGMNLPYDIETIESLLMNMFESEWILHNDERSLKTIAIIDDLPEKQFLYPEFLLFSSLFKKNGYNCFILDPSELTFHDNGLWYGGAKIDLIYNRLTDFYFEDEKYRSLKAAFESNAVLITPGPYHHSLYANKANLETFTDQRLLTELGISKSLINTLLRGIPKALTVTSSNRDVLWQNRKRYFFKPFKGYGSKATYRGDKITRKVWSEMCNGEYIAQELAQPSERSVVLNNEITNLKADLRAYTYAGKIILFASRLYSGQTTNFRTPGGGFAPVFLI